MTDSPPHPAASPKQVFGMIVRYPARWAIPALVTALAMGAYAMLRQPPWEASQALVIRNDAVLNQEAPGRFTQPEEMRTVQETILELVRSRGVLAAALQAVGPPSSFRGEAGTWPTEQDVADLRELVKLAPPKGAEFGRTEVFYLKVRDPHRDRAMALVSALCAQLELSFQKLRDVKAASLVGEIEKAVELAAKDLAESTARLSEIERQVGSDLAELRLLYDTTSGESALRRTTTEIQTELRQVRSAQKASEQLLELLKLAQAEPDRLVAMPNSLLESQPGLRRLKDGLIDAQLAASQLLGRMSEAHPQVRAAREAQRQIVHDVHEEIANAIRAVEVDLKVHTDRAALLEQQLAATTARLEKLASLRAPYANQVAETRKRVDLLERAQERLADARATQATARSSSLIARIDSPETGVRPVGPGRTLLMAIGLFGGLLVGFGVLVLFTDPADTAANVPAGNRPSEADRRAKLDGVSPRGRRRKENAPRTETRVSPGGAAAVAEALRVVSPMQASTP